MTAQPAHIARAPSESVNIAPARAPEAVRLVLPSPPSANRYWRSFVPRAGTRAITVVSDEAKAYKRDVLNGSRLYLRELLE